MTIDKNNTIKEVQIIINVFLFPGKKRKKTKGER